MSPISYKLTDKTFEARNQILKMMYEYPQNYLKGFVEAEVAEDFAKSEIMFAMLENKPVGSLMFNGAQSEFNWLVVKKGLGLPKGEVAKKLFESFYPKINSGQKVHFYVNTEDASFDGDRNFTGKSFEPARKLYKSMGLELKPDNIVKDKYGKGAHAYRVEWVPNT